MTIEKLLEFVNEYSPDADFFLEENDYQEIQFYLNRRETVEKMKKALKLVDVGNVYDFPEVFDIPEKLMGEEISAGYNDLERICISNKYEAIMHHTSNSYFYDCILLVSRAKLKKCINKVRKIISEDAEMDPFADVKFPSAKGKYTELNPKGPMDRSKQFVNIAFKTVPDEKLVFRKESVITEVKEMISNFFKDDTKKIYDKLEIPYKRGVILYGEPGNGKSAMIRELFRELDDIKKIIIGPTVPNFIKVLTYLTSTLNNEKMLIVMEDIDYVLSMTSRSEFLNFLDGIDTLSGVFFIGTTNYINKIDPAFVNRSGRFDRSYEIGNPDEEVRREFFKSKGAHKILEGHPLYKNGTNGSGKEIIELLVNYTEGFPMANLKELLTSVCYKLVNSNSCIEEAVEEVSKQILESRESQKAAFEKNNRRMRFADEDFDKQY